MTWNWQRLTVVFALCLFAPFSGAADNPWTPRLHSHVTDLARVLTAADRERLDEALARYERETSHQIAVLVVPGLDGEGIEAYSLRVARVNGLGQRGLDNGILVTLAMKERAARIELGRGFGRFISNAKAQSIIDQDMIPAFRKGDYAGGLHAGVDRLMHEARRFAVPRQNPRGR